MIDALKKIFADLLAPEPRQVFAVDDPRLAATALMIHVVAVDGMVDPREQAGVEQELKRRWGLSLDETRALAAAARAAELETASLQPFVTCLKRALSPAERRDLVRSLWELTFADGAAIEFEDNVIWRIADLLGVEPHDRVALRKEVEARSVDAETSVLPKTPDVLGH